MRKQGPVAYRAEQRPADNEGPKSKSFKYLDDLACSSKDSFLDPWVASPQSFPKPTPLIDGKGNSFVVEDCGPQTTLVKNSGEPTVLQPAARIYNGNLGRAR